MQLGITTAITKRKQALKQDSKIILMERNQNHLHVLKHLLYSRCYQALEAQAAKADNQAIAARERLLLSQALKEQYDRTRKQELVFLNKRVDEAIQKMTVASKSFFIVLSNARQMQPCI